jgi:polysaccharide export outer membrane protein
MKFSGFTRFALIIVPLILMSLTSCRVLNPNIMLSAGKDYPYDTLKYDSTSLSYEYRLAPDDVIEFRLFANDGFKMVDLIQSNSSQNNVAIRQGFEYTLDARGMAKLPILGLVKLDSMTIREAETYLEERYSQYYVKPYVILKVVNRRVIIFPGEPGQAKVISLANSNTTVFEAIAFAGGISSNGKAHKIKLIRQTADPSDPLVYKLDLSKMENIKQGNIVVQSGDVIYVEPRKRIASETLKEVTPVLSLISSFFTLYVLITRL